VSHNDELRAEPPSLKFEEETKAAGPGERMREGGEVRTSSRDRGAAGVVTALTRRASSVSKRNSKEQAGVAKVAASGGGGRLLLKSFFGLVLFPTCVACAYFVMLASDVYVSEAKITVRQALSTAKAKSGTSLLGELDVGKSGDNSQDSMIVSEYVRSRSIIYDIGGLQRLNAVYGKGSIDYLSRLPMDSNLENSWSYWKDHVTASVDTLSGMLTLRVRAYAPEDALSLSSEIIAKSERLINDISQRKKDDALKRAKEEVQLSSTGLADARSNLLSFQQSRQTIDPTETAEQALKLISSLTLQKTGIESELATSASMGIGDKPGEIQLRAKLDAIEKQIKALNSTLTGDDGTMTVSTQLRDFELLKVQQEFAEYMYKLARNSFENARQQLDQQDLYLTVVVPPLLPESATYPRPFAYTALTFAGLLITWGIVSLGVASARDSIT
jgi:capsular polysaccharide transport system permease protein